MKFTDVFWDFLSKKGIKKVFGLPGGAIDNILSSIPQGIEWINTGHELQDGFVAQIYGNYTNSVGICIVTTGPGVATVISALKNADSEANPLIVVSTYEKSHIDNFQYWNILSISKKITKYTFYVKSIKDLNLIQIAYATAKRYTTGVLLLINSNLFQNKTNMRPLTIRPPNDVLDLSNRLVALLEKELTGKKTLIVLGKGKFYNFRSVIEFIDRNKLPYITTWKGRYIIPNTLFCGRIGTLGHHSANYAVYHSTHVLIIGDVSGSLVSHFYSDKFSVILLKGKKVFTLTHRKEIAVKNSRIFELEFFENVLNRLTISVPDEWRNLLTTSNRALLKELAPISKLEQYISTAAKIYKEHRLDIPVTTGVGNHWYGVGKFMESNFWETQTNWASIGVSYANAIGMHYATGKHIWVFEGDGGTIFSLNTLMYIINNNLPMTVTIFINNLYSAVSSSFVMNRMEPSETNSVPNIPWLQMLPNSHIFSDIEKYEKYLYGEPTSTQLRFIILMVGNNISDSHIHEININEEYKTNLKNSNFEEIMKSELVIKSESY